MSDFIHKEGSGSFFQQQKKTDKAPDWKGEIMIAGNLYEVAGWNKQGKNGTFISLSAQVKGSYKSPVPDAPVKPQAKPDEQKIAVKGFEDFDDDIPF
jgi:hypothetical protein